MRGRARAPLLRRIFRTMPLMVKGETGGDALEVAGFRIRDAGDGGADAWQLRFAGEGSEVSAGRAVEPRVSLEFEPVAFLRLAAGLSSGPELFLRGNVNVEGDLMLAS